ncbi:hypothetical protein LZD49_20990 [Dyadobacter sp. CY261]|uniref:hypothetical protein n=1 Tax=Dyadobacter sp. CY261 TaxID=2907203 RepID=UPI001F33DFE1|nr:hypothetical protein [Dyadobacter sp. CY261]MCF0072969.1 hypothetical protein [Dyadobacter sp. CY261]
MENVKAVVTQVVKIWRLYKMQQLVMTVAMRQEMPFRLRNLLTRDYMICSVLKKEMANLYDALKCCMRDGCITRPDKHPMMIMQMEGDTDMALGKIVYVHRQIIAEYETLLGLINGSNINTVMIHQHCKQVANLTEELALHSQGERVSDFPDHSAEQYRPISDKYY